MVRYQLHPSNILKLMSDENGSEDLRDCDSFVSRIKTSNFCEQKRMNSCNEVKEK